MSIRMNPLVSTTSTLSTPQQGSTRIGDVVKAEVLQTTDGSVLLQMGEYKVVARSSLPLELGSVLLQVVERGVDRLVLRPVHQATADGAIPGIITASGLAVSEERCELARHAIAAGMPIGRDLILALDSLWHQLDYAPSWLPILMRMSKGRLPMNKTSAMAVRQWEQEKPSTVSEIPIYVYLDLNARPPLFSYHILPQKHDDKEQSERRDGLSHPFIVGCDTPHLGPLLVGILAQADSTSIELLLMDEERRSFVSSELHELKTQLLPMVKGLILTASCLRVDTVHAQPLLPSVRHLDIRV